MHSLSSVAVHTVVETKETSTTDMLNKVVTKHEPTRLTVLERDQVAPYSPQTLKAALILIVEDYAPSRKLLSIFLRRQGYQVDTCSTASEAIQRVADTAPDVVVLDVRLPDSNGLDLYATLRTLPQMQTSPIMFMSSFKDKRLEQTCLQRGALAFFPKPVYLPQLAACITRVLGA